MVFSIKNLFKGYQQNEVLIPSAQTVSIYAYIVSVSVAAFGIYGGVMQILHSKDKYKTQPGAKNLIVQDSSLTPLSGKEIFDRNIFNLEGVIPDYDNQSSGGTCPREVSKSRSDYDIVGILYGGSPETSMVVLENVKTKVSLILKKGEKLPGKGVLSEIFPRKVYLTFETCPEFLALADSKLPPSRVRTSAFPSGGAGGRYSEDGFERDGTNTLVTRQWVNDILQNKLSSVLEDALAQPNMVGGRIQGFVVSQITPNSVYDKLGIKNGDVVTSINGIQLNDVARAIQTLNSMRSEASIEMQVIRGGQPTTFRVNVQ